MQSLIYFIQLKYHYYVFFYSIVYLIFILNLHFNTETLVTQNILNSIRVSWVKEDIFRSFIRLWIITIWFIPFYVINLVIPDKLTFIIFCCYLIAPDEVSLIFILAHFQVICEHFILGYFIKETNYVAPKILVNIFGLVNLDFKTLVHTYMGNPTQAAVRKGLTAAAALAGTAVGVAAEDTYASYAADRSMQDMEKRGVDFSKMDPKEVHKMRLELKSDHLKNMPFESLSEAKSSFLDSLHAKGSVNSKQGHSFEAGYNVSKSSQLNASQQQSLADLNSKVAAAASGKKP
jgi:hypothetical protein